MENNELKYLLKSKKIFDVTRVLATINPKTNELIVLKNRDKNKVNINELEYYGELHDSNYEYNDLHDKKILLDYKLFNKS